MGNDIFDSEQSRSLESLMTESQKSKLKEAILKKLIEKKEEEQNTASESITESKEETPAAPLTGTEKYTSTIREHVSKKSDNRQKVIREKTDLLAGDESVTAAQLRQSNSELWQRVQTSLASLGGGGLGENDVIALVKKYSAEINLDSDDLAAIIPGVLDGLTTDEIPEGNVNLYFTDQRVWKSLHSKDGISDIDSTDGGLFLNIDLLVEELKKDSDLFQGPNFDSAFAEAFDSFQMLSTTDSLPEGDINLYYTKARVDSDITEAFEGLLDSTSANYDSTLFNKLVLNTTDSLPEGDVNFYWTDARFDSAFDQALGGAGFDSTISGIFDSTSANFDSELYNKLTLENTDSLPEGSTNLYYTDERVEALVDSAYVNARVDLPETQILSTTDSLPEGSINLYYTKGRVDSDINEALSDGSLDSALTGIFDSNSPNFNVELWNQLTLNNTDSLPEGSTNLYYTDQRVQDKIDEYVDSTFLTGQIALDDLTDVTSPSPANNQYLQYNGANWVPANLDIDAGVSFKGTIDAVDSAAPGAPANGDMYINTGSGTADASWTGLTSVDSDEQLIWGSDQASWFSFGGKADAGVVEVREGIAILVADSDAARPTVSVDKTVTDTWYYTKTQVDSSLTEIKDSLQLITGGNDSDIAVLNNTKVDRAGDTMTGDLTLPQDPTNPLHAATKQYVDAQITQLDSAFDSDIAILASATTDLTDVSGTLAQHGQILMYDSDTKEYNPVNIEEAGGGVAHHDSVPPATPFTNGQFWFSTKTTSLYVWHVNAWVKIGL